MPYKAVIAGASGLIGSYLLEILLKASEYDEVVILVRKATDIKDKKLTEIILDFEQLENYKDEIKGHVLFCCLGTTNNKTPDKALYRKIDHDYPVTLAKLAQANGVEQYHLVSSIGADFNSSTFYTKLKGETEEDIKTVGLKTLHIYQPSFLKGDRKEFRLMEKILIGLSYIIDPLLIGSLKKYRSIPAKTVAMAMYNESMNKKEGVFIHTSDNIKLIA
jgi:uncharacterized protein YbjT (DUF2867 family)